MFIRASGIPFKMLPRPGDPADAQNWRPIAVLNVMCKIVAKMLLHRARATLDQAQSEDQVGFRQGLRVEEAFAVLETLQDTAEADSLPLWFASLDLWKAFDRVEWHALRRALLLQGLGGPLVETILALYGNQVGHVGGRGGFCI